MPSKKKKITRTPGAFDWGKIAARVTEDFFVSSPTAKSDSPPIVVIYLEGYSKDPKAKVFRYEFEFPAIAYHYAQVAKHFIKIALEKSKNVSNELNLKGS